MTYDAFLARQPIVDSRHNLYGYELLFRHSQYADKAHITDDVDAGLHVIANTLCDMGTEWLLRGKYAFINMDGPMLMSSHTNLLPPEKVVIDIVPGVQPTPEIMERLTELKQLGFRFALDNYVVSPQTDPLLPLANFIKIDVLSQDMGQVRTALAHVSRYPVQLVAEKVETPAVHEQCLAAGFNYFQGYYFARPETLIAKVISPSHATVLQLMEKVQKDASIQDIETLLKKDVALTFKLLRYINSAGFGLSCEVQSIRHAVTILGMKPLYRWLTLLLATAGTSPTSPLVSRNAITRGRLCELLGAYNLSRGDQDNLFITGVFSMLDVMMETPMEDILERLVIPETIADALLGRTGMYGPILALAEACESQDPGRIAELADSLMLTPDQVTEAHLKSLAWAEQLGLDA